MSFGLNGSQWNYDHSHSIVETELLMDPFVFSLLESLLRFSMIDAYRQCSFIALGHNLHLRSM